MFAKLEHTHTYIPKCLHAFKTGSGKIKGLASSSSSSATLLLHLYVCLDDEGLQIHTCNRFKSDHLFFCFYCSDFIGISGNHCPVFFFIALQNKQPLLEPIQHFKMRWALFLLSINLLHLHAIGCRKELFYHHVYRYGYEIFCDHNNHQELYETSVYNEIMLTITESNVKLNPTLFKNIKRIRELNITNSHITFENSTNFEYLSQLETLSLTHNKLKALELNLLDGLVTLKNLNLQFNYLSGFADGTFRDLLALEALNLSHNSLTDLTGLNICELESLQQLDLSNNALTSLQNNSFSCLVNLEKLKLDNNYLSVLDHISSIRLSEIHLRFNFISKIGTLNTTNLLKLDLEGNRLINLGSKNFSELINLTFLNLRNNSIEFIDKETFTNNKKITNLMLGHNRLGFIHLNIPSLEVLDLRLNQFYVFGDKLKLLTSLKSIDLSQNKIMKVDNNTFKNLHSLRELNLSNNKFNNISLNFMTDSHLNVLNFSHNNLSVLSEDTFKNLKNLHTLDMSFNQLGYLNGSIFGNLENLEILNISYNKLKVLDYKVLEPLENLHVLVLEGNLLENVDYSSIISELPNLDVLSVKNNLLTCDFIAGMIRYFRDNDIKYTINEDFQYDKENVAGIYCKETDDKISSLQDTIGVVLNNTKMLNELYNISHEKNYISLSGTMIAMIIVTFIICFSVFCILVYKFAVWKRRKDYIIDELELMSSKGPYKRFAN